MKVVHCQSGGSVLVWTLAAQLFLCGSRVYATDGTENCKLVFNSPSEQRALSRLAPLAHMNLTAEVKIGEESYKYVFQLCGDAGGVVGAGVIQMDKKTEKATVIGLYNSTVAIGGTNWVMLSYENGEKYDGHCSKESRTAKVMILCNREVDVGPLLVMDENREKDHDCYYLFELDSSAVCPPLPSRLSTGSIILIIGFCLLAVYLIGGFLYQRLIVGAKGMEQFPNYAFWLEVGNLTADGCDFVCRSQNREEAPAYRGVSAESLEEEPEERDDHLLPM